MTSKTAVARDAGPDNAPAAADGAPDTFARAGTMGALMRQRDWSQTPLGPMENWPQSLRTSASTCLHSRFPILLWWGPELVMIYNDAYRQILGAKHPRALGQRGRESWGEIWDIIGPMLEAVLARGEATWREDQQLLVLRRGYLEETYFTFSYSPIHEESGRVGGVFTAVAETTTRVLSERRLRLLRALADRAADAHQTDAACAAAVDLLGDASADVPFALLYLLDERGERARLAGRAGLEADSVAAPAEVDLGAGGAGGGHESGSDDTSGWPLARVARTGRGEVLTDLSRRFGAMPGGPWPEPTHTAVLLPVARPGQEHPLGVLVAGASPRLPFDDAYKGFFELVADHVATAVANARAHEQERRRAEALAEIDRAKTAFFSNVSHEFRTPLTLMLGPTEDALAAPERALRGADLEAVHRNALRLLRLVNTLLDFSRIEAGRVQAAYEPTDLAALTADLSSAFRSAVERGGVRFHVDCPPLAHPVYVDHEMWEKIVLNLVSNAFKFTLEGDIRVALREAGGWAELTVRDTGAGIPADELERVFERFHRIEGTRARTHEGSGIGLALVQDLVKLHGGEIRVESEQGRGSTFTVRVPLGTAHLPRDRLRAAARHRLANATARAEPYVAEALRWLPGPVAPANGDGSGTGNGAASAAAAVAGGPARVLVADDNADMREYLGRLLGAHWAVDLVADGVQALAAVRARRPDLVLTDVMMPNLDGVGLLRALRAEPETADVPVVMLSARAGEEATVEGLQAGADDYVTKPFTARELLARVGGQIALARERARGAAALREREERLRAALTASGTGTFRWNIPAGTLEWDRSLDRLFGLPPGQTVTSIEDFVARVHPDDRAAVAAACERCAREGADFELDFRVTLPGGHERWLADRGKTFFGDDGRPAYMTGACVDITDLKSAEAALVEADRRKDEFLAMLGHELRNPLGAIGSALQLLSARRGDERAEERARAVLGRQVAHMTRLLDDLLDVSRITRGKVELRRARVDLCEVIRRAVETTRPLMDAQRHALEVALPGEPVWLDADPMRMEQVVSNLLTNAAKYTPHGGRVWVSLAREGGAAVMRVRDTGVGIPAEALPRVFDLFVQGEQSLDRAQGGLGIGLTLVRGIVELHGGRVEARSEGRGRGSEFVVVLPLADAAGVAKGAATEAGGPARAAGTRAARPLRVLVVDDNDDVAEMTAEMLGASGYEVRVAGDGASALAAAEHDRPDAVLLDLGLPVFDGYEVARRLRSDPANAGVLLVALSGYGQEGDRQRTREAGFDHHLVKPVDFDALLRLLARKRT